MIQNSLSLLKRLAPPAFARTRTEKSLAELATIRKLTWLDIAIGLGIVSDFVLSLVDVNTHWRYIGSIEVVLSLYLLALLLVPAIASGFYCWHLRTLYRRLRSICRTFPGVSNWRTNPLDLSFVYATFMD